MANFTVVFPCKPYVKRFLEQNYGCPVDFTKDKILYPDFRSKLEKKNFRYEKRYDSLKFTRYTQAVEIRITRDDFYRSGWELSKTDIVNFNRSIENRVKILMYNVVSSQMAFGISQTDSISYFQENYDFPEEVWSKESINKDCQRNLSISKNEIQNNLSKLIDKILLEKLSSTGIISQPYKKRYETHTI